MYTEDDIALAIEANRSAAVDALTAIQLADPIAVETGGIPKAPLLAAGLDGAADALGEPHGTFWVERIVARDLLHAFAVALAARGVTIDLPPVAMDAGHVPFDAAARFPRRAASFRCRILRGGMVSGSGILVGPSTVLTAWHVVAPAGAYQPDAAISGTQVVLSDGRTYDASIIAASPCSSCEFSSKLPADDLAIATLHDMALLRLSVPAGAALGFAELSTDVEPFKTRRPLYLVHYPEGINRGLAEGVTGKIRKILARIGHTAPSSRGSSGGGCFDTKRQLIGIHQGKQPNGAGRFVPLERFSAQARQIIADDVAPPSLWSVTNTADGRLIIGRSSFFQSFAAASENGRVRGIHIKRADPLEGPSELGFSYEILESLIGRSPDARLCRLAFGTLVEDIPGEIVRRVSDSGLVVAALEERPGVGTGETAPEAVGADRGARAAELVNSAAEAAGVTIWLFFDQPAVAFGDEQRSAMEGIIARSLRMPNIRVVISGLEAAAIPGQDYYPGGILEGPPGLMIDYIQGFDRAQVIDAITLASLAADSDIGTVGIAALADVALQGLPAMNGIIAATLSAEVAARLQVPIRTFFKESASG